MFSLKKMTIGYKELLTDLKEPVRDAFYFALEMTNELCKEAPNSEFRKSTFQSIFWELMHDLLIRNRQPREKQDGRS